MIDDRIQWVANNTNPRILHATASGDIAARVYLGAYVVVERMLPNGRTAKVTIDLPPGDARQQLAYSEMLVRTLRTIT